MKVALYGRVSTNQQETDNQFLQLRSYCLASGHDIVLEFVDAGVSGKAAKGRPAFGQMMDAARKRQFDLLLFWSLDRLSREGARETLNHLQALTDYGVAWRSHTEAYLDSLGPFAPAIVALLGVLAKQERVKISERTRAGLARTKAKRTQLGRRTNFKAYSKVLDVRQNHPGASERALARLAGVSRTTVNRALSAT